LSTPDPHAPAGAPSLSSSSTSPSDPRRASGDAPDAGEPHEENAARPSPLKNPRVRLALSIATLLLAAGGIWWAYHWWTEGRFLEATNNAYLQADSVAVAPRINGHVTEVLVRDNQAVRAGEPLVRIDSRNYQAMLEQAQAVTAVREADIAAARANIEAQNAALEQARAQEEAARTSLAFAGSEVRRFEPLALTGADTHEHVEALRHQRDQAQAQYTGARAQVKSAQGRVLALRAQLAQAQAGLKQAQADLDRARIPVDDALVTAPIAGRIGDRTVQVGQVVAAGTRLMSVVPLDALYLQANFKETQVGWIRPGQPARIEVDALPGVRIDGEVESVSPGTGSQFALLPAENATGNFTKIVQRLTVRIKLQPTPEQRQVLVPGMSVEVTVDTRSAREGTGRTDRPTGTPPAAGR